MKKLIRVGSRESKLALAQTNWVISQIKNKFPSFEFQVVKIKTQGDMILDKKLDKIGGKGLFIKELEYALLDNSIDLAVHSMKDMPADLPNDLTIAAISKREEPWDVLVTLDGKKLNQLREGAIIGTSSVRREVQIKMLKPGLVVKTLRGNVLTRLSKLENGEYDAILLAQAGLNRLGLQDKCSQTFTVHEMVPGVGQGALGIETRKDENISYLLDSIHDETSAIAVNAERAFMSALKGSCSTPVGAHGIVDGDILKLYGMFAINETSFVYRAYIEGNKKDSLALGVKLAEEIIGGRNNG